MSGQFNVTAQAYNLLDENKQTLLINELISAHSKEDAIDKFHKESTKPHLKIIKVYSVEKV